MAHGHVCIGMRTLLYGFNVCTNVALLCMCNRLCMRWYRSTIVWTSTTHCQATHTRKRREKKRIDKRTYVFVMTTTTTAVAAAAATAPTTILSITNERKREKKMKGLICLAYEHRESEEEEKIDQKTNKFNKTQTINTTIKCNSLNSFDFFSVETYLARKKIN